jgi:general secretion pathway protein K
MHRQRGVALLVALLVVALAVILIAALLARGDLALARTRNLLRGEQAQAYAQGLEAYAAQVLTKTRGDGPDTRASPWAMPLPTQPVPGGSIGATMIDQNGCFNLNNLSPGNDPARAEWQRIFRKLLEVLGLRADLSDAVEGWLDAERRGAEANFYLAQAVPYRPRGGQFAHVSELRLVRGVSGEVYARLAPYVCVLPPGTKLNINTASLPLLWSLDKSLTRADAERLWKGGQARYGSLVEFRQEAGPALPQALDSVLDTSSTYFLARSDIVLDAVPFTFYSLIERKPVVRVLQRSRGADTALVTAAPIAGEDTP